MTLFRRARLIALLPSLIGLGSCQQSYNVIVEARNGQLVFHISPLGWGRWTPRVIALKVAELSSPEVIVWEIKSPNQLGPVEIAEIVFGQVPKGMTQVGSQKPVQTGHLYQVAVNPLEPGMSGQGNRRFVITNDYGEGEITSLRQSDFHR